MIRFFRHIRKKLIKQDNIRKPASPAGRYLLYAIGEFLLVVIGILRPVRDYLWVEMMDNPDPHRAVSYGICRISDIVPNYMAYLPAGQAGLRHAVLRAISVFYRYVVPTGQNPSAKSLNSQNPRFSC